MRATFFQKSRYFGNFRYEFAFLFPKHHEPSVESIDFGKDSSIRCKYFQNPPQSPHQHPLVAKKVSHQHPRGKKSLHQHPFVAKKSPSALSRGKKSLHQHPRGKKVLGRIPCLSPTAKSPGKKVLGRIPRLSPTAKSPGKKVLGRSPRLSPAAKSPGKKSPRQTIGHPQKAPAASARRHAGACTSFIKN